MSSMFCDVIIVRRCQHCSATINGVPCVSKLDHDMRCDVIIVRRCHHCSAMSSLFGDVNIVRRCHHCSTVSTLFGDVNIVRLQLIYKFMAWYRAQRVAKVHVLLSLSVHTPACTLSCVGLDSPLPTVVIKL